MSKKNKWSYTTWDKTGKKSKHFDSFKVYIIRCYNDSEEFYKIGKTFNTLEKRFQQESMPYTFEVVDIVDGNAFYISRLEHQYHKQLKEYKYTPLIKFEGSTECFSSIKTLEHATKSTKTV